MSKTKKITLGVIGVLLIFSLVIGISYAAWRLTLTQTNQNTLASSCFDITFEEENPILLENTFPMYDEDGKTLTPYTFTIKNNCSAYATYQIQLEIINTSTLKDEYLKIMIDEKNPVILNTLQSGEKTLSDASRAYIIDNNALDVNEEKTYNIRVWLDENVTTETEGVQNSSWSAKITVNAQYSDRLPTFCDMNPQTGACEILAKGETDELKFDNTTDNNLRYIGANPNNYVSFNNELWRIIGVFNNIDDGTGKKETRLKIIRNEPIGTYSWDNKASGTGSSISEYGSNDWSDSALQLVLNSGAYWNRTSGECPYGRNGATTSCDFSATGLTEEAKSMISNAKWNLGGTSSYTSISNGLASHFYGYERGTDVYTNRPTKWIGSIGLMYASDYGYATAGGSTTNRQTCLNTELYNWDGYDDCFNNDWLYIGSYQWTLTPGSSLSYDVVSVYSDGDVVVGIAYNTYNAVSPAIYLSSNVKISGGEGTESSPYELSL